MTCTSAANSALVELDEIALYQEPSAEYAQWETSSRAFFEGTAWGDVLRRGMRTKRFYLWDHRHALGHALTCFRRGPVKVGYLGFPICTSVASSSKEYGLERMVAAVRAMPDPPHMLRVPVSAFGNRSLHATGNEKQTTESCITDLSTWRADGTAARRRYLSVAKRRCSALTICDSATGIDMHRRYVDAVTRHHGNLRYSREAPVHFFGMADDAGLAGMVLTARHGDAEYYIHGGTRQDALGLGVADLLMERAISSAAAMGAARFNFLLSPLDQPGLIRFKEKWGGISLPAHTRDIPLTLVGHFVARMLA